ncbi:MAG TPA: serine--tRNA ligase, partial [Solirubrobacteraceae bacterium]|nr:serine--tRNA ligase [Solirubrobacteraceae bacterium]
MLDLRLIRRDPDAVRAALARRGDDGRLDEVLDLDADWRAATASAERLRAEQKTASDAIAEAKRAGEDAGPLLERMRDMSAQVKSLTERARTAEERLQGVLATLPNLPDPTSADEDTVIREVGEPRIREGRDHLELAGERVDMERAARLS